MVEMKEIVIAVLSETYSAESKLRPDVFREVAIAVEVGRDLNFGRTAEGDKVITPELIDLIYKSALFIAAVVKIIKDVQDISYTEIDRRARESDDRLADITQADSKTLIQKTKEKMDK